MRSVEIIHYEEQIRCCFGMAGIDVSRCSQVLFSQLSLMPKQRLNITSAFQFVQLEVAHLEGIGRTVTKKAKPMKGGLSGLMHKHFYVPGYNHPAKNLQNAWRLRNGETLAFTEMVSRLAAPYEGKEQSIEDLKKFSNDLANEFVFGKKGITERQRMGKATGDWLIYFPYKEKNYYLCIAKHEDTEDFILNAVRCCFVDFPFLKLILQ